MSAEYQPNLSFVSQIPAEFIKLREYSANPDISWIFYQPAEILKKSAVGSASQLAVALRPHSGAFGDSNPHNLLPQERIGVASSACRRSKTATRTVRERINIKMYLTVGVRLIAWTRISWSWCTDTLA